MRAHTCVRNNILNFVVDIKVNTYQVNLFHKLTICYAFFLYFFIWLCNLYFSL